MTARRQLLALTALVSLLGSTGCAMLHELQPHRLWRLNQASSPMAGGSAAYYSIPELPVPTTAKQPAINAP
ncbi:hypothetical protein GC176_20955 [bacterium]|nr:hypothetical protein [bacterium]